MDLSFIVKSWMHQYAPRILDVYERFTFVEWAGIAVAMYLIVEACYNDL